MIFLARIGFLASIAVSSTVLAFSSSGHHVIGVVAYELLSPDDRASVIELLSHHPDFEQYFQPPKGMTDKGSIERWQMGVAGSWPDIIRGSDQDRPTWHYQLGACLVIGDVTTPETPGPLPDDATMDTQELYIEQATTLCLRVFKNKSLPKSERAVALCWLLHLVADGHQPCHAGSLYASAFPDGDRGANSIKLVGGGNLHSAWDRLLGGNADANDVRRRVAEIVEDKRDQEVYAAWVTVIVNHEDVVGFWVEPKTWLDESNELAKSHVYTSEVMEPVIAVSRGLTDRVPAIKLSDQYFQDAGAVARHRAKQAGFRLAVLIGHDAAAATSNN